MQECCYFEYGENSGSVKVVDYLSDCVVSVAAHYFYVVKYRSVVLYGLPDAVFEDFEGNSYIEAVLNE